MKKRCLSGSIFLFVLFFPLFSPWLLFPSEVPDSTQVHFLQFYRQFLERQAHLGLWEGEVLRRIHQDRHQSLEFRQWVQPEKSDWLLEEKPGPPVKDAASEWMTRHSGSGYGAPFLTALTGVAPSQQNPYGWQGRSVRHLNFVPSDLEIDVLTTLWEQPLQTDLELYRSVSSRWRLTAEQLQKMLAGMAEEGLVARKQISPQNLFTIFLPFRTVYVEESSLNRKNRVFLYKPTVKRKQIVSILLQKLETSPLRPEEKRALRRKLKRVLGLGSANR